MKGPERDHCSIYICNAENGITAGLPNVPSDGCNNRLRES